MGVEEVAGDAISPATAAEAPGDANTSIAMNSSMAATAAHAIFVAAIGCLICDPRFGVVNVW